MVMCSKLKSHPFCLGIGRRVFNVSCAALPVERQVVPFELISIVLVCGLSVSQVSKMVYGTPHFLVYLVSKIDEELNPNLLMSF